nr:MAG TPA: hypothetical protein [Podoviridae sp. ctY3D12]
MLVGTVNWFTNTPNVYLILGSSFNLSNAYLSSV